MALNFTFYGYAKETVYSYLFIFLGIFLMGLSREKQEDEFTIYLRTRSALTAIAIMFGLRILFAIVFALFSISHSEQLNDGIWKDLWKSSEGLTNYGGAFLLYFIIYKIRLARYNICLKRDNQLAGYEE